MKKLTRKNLSELAKTLPVIEKDVQSSFVGGGDGTYKNPYTMGEIEPLINNGTFKGGYVKADDGARVAHCVILQSYDADTNTYTYYDPSISGTENEKIKTVDGAQMMFAARAGCK